MVEIAAKAVAPLEELGCPVELVEKVFDDPSTLWMAEFYAGVGTRLKQPLTEAARPDRSRCGRRCCEPALDQTLEDYYARVFQRYEFREKVRQFFERFDLLLTPTTPTPAFDVNRDLPAELEGANIVAWVAYTYPFNLCGLPAASVPCGFTRDGLPVGLQIVSRAAARDRHLPRRRLRSRRPGHGRTADRRRTGGTHSAGMRERQAAKTRTDCLGVTMKRSSSNMEVAMTGAALGLRLAAGSRGSVAGDARARARRRSRSRSALPER